MPDDTRDRLIALEANVRHLTLTVDEMAATVKELSQLLHAAKGARWAIMGAAAIGGFISAKFAHLLPWLASSPKV